MALVGRLVRPSVLRCGARNAYIYTEKDCFGCIGGPLGNPAPVNSENPIYRNTEIDALTEKAKGDWKKMSPEEIRKLYKMHFLETVADSTANTGEIWRVVGQSLVCCAISLVLFMLYERNAGPIKCKTMTYTWRLKELELDVRSRNDIMSPVVAELYEAMKPDLERQRAKFRAELQLEEKYKERVAQILAEAESKE
ncbi:uncharacterized protein LOC135819489 [Sycon ciliatum]|uniref:uncharacterized protein LOC135819489 n=1 Tax=Sycon ciliatum TaxID=27933 RepID=UPI0020AE3307|eukprot:scpid69528/ scgid18024/ 